MKITRHQLRELILQEYRKYKGKGDNPCWKGFSPGAQTGKKTKKGKSGRVANCERIKEENVEEQTLTDFQNDPYKRRQTHSTPSQNQICTECNKCEKEIR